MKQTFREFKLTARLALPIIIGFVGQGLLMFIDTLMIGGILGERAIASATLANSASWLPLMICIGLSMSVPVFIAQLHGKESLRRDGENSRERIRAGEADILRHGLLIQALASVVSVAALAVFVCGNGFCALGQPEDVARLADPYTLILAASLPAAAFFTVIKSARDATGKQWRGLVWTLAGIVSNIFFNYVLMTGFWIFPDMGLNGAAAGTLISRLISLVGIAAHGGLRLDLKLGFRLKAVREALSFGIPCSAQGIFEGGFFVISPFFMGWINEASIAANAVAVTVSSFVFTIPLGLSQAMSIRVGEAFGAGRIQRIFRIAAGMLAFTLVLMLVNGGVTITFNREIAGLFNLTGEGVETASGFLVITGFYALFDGIQCVSSGVMRGMNDVKIISYATFIAYWPGACAVGLFLAFPCGLAGNGIWIGIALALFLLAVFFTVRWIWLAGKLKKRRNAVR